MESSVDVIKRYLTDAIAAENSFETQLRAFAKEGDEPQVQAMFEEHADETKQQYEMLTARLEALGGTVSSVKSFIAHLFSLAPSTAKLGHEEAERVTQNLMMAFAVENSEVAMYESLANAASAANDVETEQLARRIQQQEKQTAEKVFAMIPQVARRSFYNVTTKGEKSASSSTASH